uniref:Uncharacterized protein n=1 Tax=Zea mays TaxID=4577 RepID=C0PN03_MAIZE|nr:unknown [Zea mays]
MMRATYNTVGHLPSTRFHASCYARHDLVFCFQLHHSSCVCSKLSPEMFSVERQRLVEFCKALVMDVSAVAPSPSRRPNDCPRHVSPPVVSAEFLDPGSLKYGLSFSTRPWMETRTCSMLELDLPHFSHPLPHQVFRRLRHTFPLSYRFGFSRSPPEW